MSGQSFFVFFSIAIVFNCFDTDAQRQWQMVNNICTQVHPSAARTQTFGTAYIKYTTGNNLTCGMIITTKNPDGVSANVTVIYFPDKQNKVTDASVYVILNPNKIGESQGFLNNDTVPFRNTATLCNSAAGYAVISCPFQNDTSSYIINVLTFNRQTRGKALKCLIDCVKSEYPTIQLKSIYQKSDCPNINS